MDSHATQERKKSSGGNDQRRSAKASTGKSDGIKPSEQEIGGKTPLGIDSSSRVKPVSNFRLNPHETLNDYSHLGL